MASPTYVPGSRYGLRAWDGASTLISDLDTASQSLVSDIESKALFYAEMTHAARLAITQPTGLSNRIVKETDTGSYFFDTGTAWVQLAGTKTRNQAHAWVTDDTTSPSPGASIVASWTNYPDASESVTLLGIASSCVAQGATASTFKLRTDHAAHGTLADVTLAGPVTTFTPPAGASTFLGVNGGPMALSSLDKVVIVCTNAGTGTSTGLDVEFVTGHTV